MSKRRAFRVSWDNGHACDTFPGIFSTHEAAESFGRDWQSEMIAMTPEATEEDYTFEVEELSPDEAERLRREERLTRRVERVVRYRIRPSLLGPVCTDWRMSRGWQPPQTMPPAVADYLDLGGNGVDPLPRTHNGAIRLSLLAPDLDALAALATEKGGATVRRIADAALIVEVRLTDSLGRFKREALA